MRKAILLSATLLILSLTLFFLNVAGMFKPPVENRVTQSGIKGFNYRSMSPSRAMREFELLKARARELSPEETARTLLKLVSESYFHTDKVRIDVYDNYLWWLVGLAYKPAQNSEVADALWRQGGGLCHAAAIIYVVKAEELGLKAHLLTLDGHVVAEVKLPSGWRVVDADYGVFWDYSLQEFIKAADRGGVAREYLKMGFGKGAFERITHMALTQENNKVVQFPNAPRRYAAERASMYVKWIIPFLLLFAAVRVRAKRQSLLATDEHR